MAGVMNPGQRQGLLDQVAKGIGIARDIYGIKADMDRSENEQKAREEKDVLSPPQVADLSKTHDISSKPLAGAIEVMTKGADGKLTPMFAMLRPKEAAPQGGTYKTVAGKDGKPVERWLPHGGPDQPAYVAPRDPKEDKTPGNTADLRKEYNAHPVTKATNTMAGAFNKIQKTVEKPDPNGAGDISLVYSFMKMNDPDSAVREGEYATAENSGGVSDKITNIYNKILDGQRLTPEQRQAFASQAGSLMAAQLESQAEQDDRYSALAAQFKLDPQFVIDKTFANLRTKLSQPPKQGPGQGAGEAYAAPGGAPGPALNDIDAELKRRGVNPRGASGGF